MPRRRRPPRAGALADLQPLKIASQMALLQALFYAAALVLMLFTALVAGFAFSADMVLGWASVRGDTARGWLLALVWLLDGGMCVALAVIVVVARSKLVPDFALTVHLVHLLLTSLYERALPRNAMWWATMLASAALALVLATWGCRYRELQPVFFAGRRGPGLAAADPEPALPDDDARGRPRAADTDAEYEMVQMTQPT